MIALVTTANTYDEWRIVTNQLIVRSDETIGSYDQANTARTHANNAFANANSAFVHANSGYARANVAWDHANNAYARANVANNTAVGNTNGGAFSLLSTRNKLNFIPGSNILINVEDDAAGDRANITITSTAVATGNAVLAYDQANTARIHANAAFAGANDASTQATTARDHANVAFAKANTANNIAVGNTSGSTFTQRSARARINFIPGTNITLNVDDDSSGDRVNVTITSTAADGTTANAAIVQANTARTHANNAYAQANTGSTQATTARDHANNAYAQANTGQTTGVAAFAKANAALANTTTTLAGALTITQNVQATNVRATTAFVFPNGNVMTNLTVSTSSPTGGANGDIWLKII